jgi:hypothetical protein
MGEITFPDYTENRAKLLLFSYITKYFAKKMPNDLLFFMFYNMF